MGLFKADLFRSFAVGFVLGTLVLVAVLSGPGDSAKSRFTNNVVPPASAQSSRETPVP